MPKRKPPKPSEIPKNKIYRYVVSYPAGGNQQISCYGNNQPDGALFDRRISLLESRVYWCRKWAVPRAPLGGQTFLLVRSVLLCPGEPLFFFAAPRCLRRFKFGWPSFFSPGLLWRPRFLPP
jgi:hypothetical protein